MKREGYSLIELLVVFGVTTVLGLVGIASYNRFNDRQVLKQAAEDFVLKLKTVQKQANSGERPTDCDQPMDRYEVRNQGGNKYRIRLYCGSPISSEVIDLKTGVTFLTGGAGNFQIDFLPLGRGMQVSGTPQLRYGSCTQSVDVESGGTITLGTLTCP